jgi:hypothetical protein
VECRVAGGQDAGEGALQVQDTYALSPLPGRILQSVLVDGREVLRHDIGAEPGTGWATVTIPAEARWVVVRVLAIRPDPGALWGLAAVTPIRVVPVDAGPRTPP